MDSRACLIAAGIAAALAETTPAQTSDNFAAPTDAQVKVHETGHGLTVSVKDGTVTLPALSALVQQQVAAGGGRALTTSLDNLRINVKDGSLTLPLTSTIDQSLIGLGTNDATIVTDLSRIRVNVKDGTLSMPITSTIEQNVAASGSAPVAASNLGNIETNLTSVRVNVRDGTVSIPVNGTIQQGISAAGAGTLSGTASNSGTVNENVSQVRVMARDGTVTIPVNGQVTQAIWATAAPGATISFSGTNHGAATAEAPDVKARLKGDSGVSVSTHGAVQQSTQIQTGAPLPPPGFLHRLSTPSPLR